jgi:uncharacterized glyoxalase superfamily protein PhnB
MKNRSLPVDTVLPHLAYRNVSEAVAWLSRVFGFREHYRYGEPGNESGAQIFAGDACIMVHRVNEGERCAEDRPCAQAITIFVEDVESHCQRSKAAGATIVEEPHETVYGEFQYAVIDLDGHRWLFSRHARDLAPEDWGARTALVSGR